jgi:hypothetical protein
VELNGAGRVLGRTRHGAHDLKHQPPRVVRSRYHTGDERDASDIESGEWVDLQGVIGAPQSSCYRWTPDCVEVCPLRLEKRMGTCRNCVCQSGVVTK